MPKTPDASKLLARVTVAQEAFDERHNHAERRRRAMQAAFDAGCTLTQIGMAAGGISAQAVSETLRRPAQRAAATAEA
jgi:hypothetical protein